MMRIDELRKGFRGYKKADVYQYVSSLEEMFSQKLAEADAAVREARAQAEKQVHALEEQLASLQEENQTLKEKQQLTFDTLLDAQAYAKRMREETLSQEQEARQNVQERRALELQELEGYKEKIDRFRETFRTAVEEMDRLAERLDLQAQELLFDLPDARRESTVLTFVPPGTKSERDRAETGKFQAAGTPDNGTAQGS